MKLGEFKKYLKVYFLLAHASFSQVLVNRFSAVMFLVGKILRFVFSLFLIMVVVGQTQGIAGYTLSQAVLFFLIFNLMDIIVQVFFRGVYWFRGTIVSGSFDFFLLKPLNPLFQALLGHPDFLDIITLIPLLIFTFSFIVKNSLLSGWQNIFIFGLLFLSGLVLASALHIIILAVGVLTTEVDNAIWIYRDLSGMLRLPLKIYNRPIKLFLTFVLPIAIIFTFPAKALLGILSWPWLGLDFLYCLAFCFFALKLWNQALKKYASASS